MGPVLRTPSHALGLARPTCPLPTPPAQRSLLPSVRGCGAGGGRRLPLAPPSHSPPRLHAALPPALPLPRGSSGPAARELSRPFTSRARARRRTPDHTKHQKNRGYFPRHRDHPPLRPGPTAPASAASRRLTGRPPSLARGPAALSAGAAQDG